MFLTDTPSRRNTTPEGLAYAAYLKTPRARICVFMSTLAGMLRESGIFNDKDKPGVLPVAHLRGMLRVLKANLAGKPTAFPEVDQFRRNAVARLEAFLASPKTTDAGGVLIGRSFLRIKTGNKVTPWLPSGREYAAESKVADQYAALARQALSMMEDQALEKSFRAGTRVVIVAVEGPNQYDRVKSRSGSEVRLASGLTGEFFWSPPAAGCIQLGHWEITNGGLRSCRIRPLLPLEKEIAAANMGRWTGRKILPSYERIHDGRWMTASVVPKMKLSCAHLGVLAFDEMTRDILPGVGYGNLVAYMIRRFGYPPYGDDNAKALCGAWMLTTPKPDLFVNVRPSPAGIEFGFFYAMAPGLAQKLGEIKEALNVAHLSLSRDPRPYRKYLQVIGAYNRAACMTITDLLRPVAVRDMAINVMGEVPEDALHTLPGADYSPESTRAVNPAFMENAAEWRGFLAALEPLGSTPAARIAKITKQLARMPLPKN